MDLRGRSERIVSVASDGARTRYQQRLGCLSRNRVGALHQLGWYRRLMKSCPKEIWGRTFFILLFQERNEEDVRRRNTMAMASAADAASKKSTKQ